MTQVWNSAPYSEGTLLTLLALADWADDEGKCFPKLTSIAKKARLSQRGVTFCLKRLIDDGAIEITQESTGPGRSRTYQIGTQYLLPLPKERWQLTAATVAVNSINGSSNQQRNKEEPSYNRHINRQENLLSLSCEPNGKDPVEIIGRAFDYFCKQAGKTSAYTLTPSRQKMALRRWNEIEKRLIAEGVTPDSLQVEIKKTIAHAIDGLLEDEFMRSHGFIDWEQIFRSQEKFQKRIERFENPPARISAI